MDFVLLNNLDPDGLECAEANVQCDLGDFNATGSNAVENLGCEMQPGGGSCDRTKRLGVNRLVLLAVEGGVGAINVGREWNVPDALKNSEEVSYRIEAQVTFAEGASIDDFGGEVVRISRRISAEVNALTDTEFASGIDRKSVV